MSIMKIKLWFVYDVELLTKSGEFIFERVFCFELLP